MQKKPRSLEIKNLQYSIKEIAEIQRAIQIRPLPVTILTGSMHPVLKVNQIYSAAWRPATDIRRFDIVLYLDRDRTMICHYVWHINVVVDSGTLVTRPLLGRREDLPVDIKDIIGVIQDAKISLWRRVMLSVF